jgi:hypothetical protein
MVDEGHFDSGTKGSGGRRLVLEIGCNEGKISAIFARAIAARQEGSRFFANLHWIRQMERMVSHSQ